MKYIIRSIPVLVLASYAAASAAQGWMLKRPAATKTTWNLSVAAPVHGHDMQAKLDYHLDVKGMEQEKVACVASWDHLVVDDEEQGDVTTWELALAPSGAILLVKDGEEFARMLMPFFFSYPNKEVQPGDKWSDTVKLSRKSKDVRIDYEVLEKTSAGGEEVLKIAAKFKEEGEGGMEGDDLFWVQKNGTVNKFELKLKNWAVPMVNSGPIPATIKGTIATK